MADIKLKITRHALDRMNFYGISEEQITLVIKQGAKIKQQTGYLASYTYIKVAYRKTGEGIYKIKTVFVDQK